VSKLLKEAPLTLMLCAGTALLAATAICQGQAAIGLLITPDHPESESLQRGVTLALEHANLQGPKYRLAIRGRPGQWGTEGDEAAALALDEEAVGIITPSDAVAAHQVLQVSGRTRIPVVSLCPDSSITRAGIPWTVRIVPGNEAEAMAIFSGLTEGNAEKLRSWAALVPPERSGREKGRDLLAAADHSRVALQAPLSLPADSGQSPAILEKILSLKPDAILIWLEPGEAGKWTRDLRQSGFSGLLAGPGALRTRRYLASAGNAAEGTIVPEIFSGAPTEERLRQFSKAFKNRFATEPDLTAAVGYDSAGLLVELLRSSGREPLFRSFPIGGTFEGTSGTIRFDQEGNRVAALRLMVCRSGKFQPVRRASNLPVDMQ
jgi:ABC-type branched-subunit amino acid transport system substrate-binding protein